MDRGQKADEVIVHGDRDFAYDLINEPSTVGTQPDGWDTGRIGEESNNGS